MPERLRLPPGRACPPEPRDEPRDRLPRQGLRELPAADARPAGLARARLARAQPGRPRRRAGRAARLRRRPAQLLPGRGRDRGLSRHGAPAQSRCAATRRCSTTRCTTAATPARSFSCGRRGRATVDAPGADAAADQAAPMRRARRSIPPAYAEALAAGAGGVRDAARRRRCAPEHNEIDFHTWGDASAACRRARRARRCAGHFPDLRRGRRAAVRGGARPRAPARPPTPTRRTATSCGSTRGRRPASTTRSFAASRRREAGLP